MAAENAERNAWEPRHNVVCFMDTTDDKAEHYRPMVAFLQRSRIFTAITLNTPIYKAQVGTFWANARVNNDEPEPRIISTVAGRQVVISEALIRDFFQFGDAPDMETTYPNEFILGAMMRIGYPGPPETQYVKSDLPKVWRFLFHVIIVCLSPRKAGFDGMSSSSVSAGLSLIFNKPFNFSGYIFKGMLDNLLPTAKLWNLYPRFIQLLMNHTVADLPAGDPEQTLRLTPMNNRIWTFCAKGPHANDNFPLFGAIINAD